MTKKHVTPNSSLHRARKAKIVAIGLVCLLIIVFFTNLNTGYIRLSPAEVIATLFGQGTAQQSLILFDFRLPRMVIAVLVGIGLAISGTILQGIVRNPLADPGIIGINAGAGLAIMLFVSLFSITTAVSIFLMPILAFIGAAGAALVIYLLAYKRVQGVSPIRIVITGVAVAAGINALMIVFTLKLNPESYQFLAVWLAGSIWGANWQFVIAVLPWLVVLIPYVYAKSMILNILHLGEETSIGLGANLEKERRILLGSAVALAAASVAVSGGIGFVGLLAPHLTRRLVGDKHEYVIPISGLVGAVLLLTADMIGRMIKQPEIPAGIIVAVIGAPYFLYLLAKIKD